MKIFKSPIWIGSILVLLACNIGTRAASPAPAASPIPPTQQAPAAIAVVPTPTTVPAPNTTGSSSDTLAQAQQKIKHIVIIMQENRSFDEYFGTYPGADGIPMQNGVPTVCSPDPKTGQCIKTVLQPGRRQLRRT